MADPTALTQCILPYVISTCHRKICRRLKATTSQLYIKALNAVEIIEPSNRLLMNDRPSARELDNDCQFLLDYVLAGTKMHPDNVKIPELTKQANQARSNKPFKLYSKETYVEFHLIFKYILTGFDTALRDLQSDSTRSTKGLPTPASPKVNKLIYTVVGFGYALQALSQGSGFKVYLQSMSALLQQALDQLEDEPAPTTQTEDDDDLADELDSVHSSVESAGVEIPLWQRFLNWIQVVVNHFDAVDILIKYVTSPYFSHSGISLQFLSPPPTGPRLLPWQELFTKPNLFPTITLPDRHQKDQAKGKGKAMPHANVNNEEIFQFIKAALKDVAVLDQLEDAWPDNTKATALNLQALTTSKLPGWAPVATANLTRLKEVVRSTLGTDPVVGLIDQDIRKLRASAYFFEGLEDKNSFDGALHCEGCLAAILSPSGGVDEGLSMQFQVSCISHLF